MRKNMRCLVCGKHRKKSHDKRYPEHLRAYNLITDAVATLQPTKAETDLASQLENMFR